MCISQVGKNIPILKIQNIINTLTEGIVPLLTLLCKLAVISVAFGLVY